MLTLPLLFLECAGSSDFFALVLAMMSYSVYVDQINSYQLAILILE